MLTNVKKLDKYSQMIKKGSEQSTLKRECSRRNLLNRAGNHI